MVIGVIKIQLDDLEDKQKQQYETQQYKTQSLWAGGARTYDRTSHFLEVTEKGFQLSTGIIVPVNHRVNAHANSRCTLSGLS